MPLQRCHGYPPLFFAILRPRQGPFRAPEGIWVEMKQVNAGSLRAIGYDPSQRVLRVEMTNGSLMEYSGVSEDTWRRFAGSGSQWSFFRDNIEENYTERRVR